MALKLITAPAEEPVTIAEARAQCRYDDTSNDTILTLLIQNAREQAEHRLGRALITQTWELALDAFPDSEIELPKPPVQSIASVKYLDASGVEQTVGGSNYSLDTYGLRHWAIPVYGYSWPVTYDAANAVKVRFVTGYGLAAAVPAGIKAWMLLAIATLDKNREAVLSGSTSELPRDFMEGLLDPFKVYAL